MIASTTTASTTLNHDVLQMNYHEEVARIGEWMRDAVGRVLRKRGLVIAMSGGIDSSVSAALAVRALGPTKVFGLLLPERDSSSFSSQRGRLLAEHLGIAYEMHDIAATLDAIGCYRWRDDAIRSVFPQYGAGWKNKIVIRGGMEGQFNHFMLVVQQPDGQIIEKRLELKQYLQIVAATNYKQRVRKTIEYFHADRLNYAVTGTPNRLEYDQGFFVKNGDGAADIKPIAHLYKSQVYALARHLELPDDICAAVPTTDTYSMPQGQDEFYFALPYQQMDYALWAYNHQIASAELASFIGLSETQAQHIYHDIETKRQSTAYLHAAAQKIEAINGLPEVDCTATR